MRLSIIIPAYNEELRLTPTLTTLQEYLAKQDYEGKIIVVDDGSTDGTAALVTDSFPEVILISYAPNRGKGHAVKTGMLQADADYALFYDADAATPIDEVEKIWASIEHGAEVVIGSRSLPDSQVEIHQPWYRECMGRIYNLILRCFGLTTLIDTQCGFKCFSRKAREIIFPRQTIDGFSFDIELLHIAHCHDLKVGEVPVRWLNDADSKVNPIIDSSKMFIEICAIRIKSLRGAYR